MRTFCTIITSNYFPFAETLYKSISKFYPQEILHVLICDETSLEINSVKYPNIKTNRLKDILHIDKADILVKKYSGGQMDSLRWSLKSVYINFLLQIGFDKVIYTDCDIHFFSEYKFLFEELDKNSLLLTPARFTSNPLQHEEEFLSGYKYGMFNAGFIGATKAAMPALQWWANCCAYKVDTDFGNGLFVDQKYLDAAPVLFDNVGILKHKGCNIAFWNHHECKRVKKNDEVLINGEFRIVFIHFTNKYIPEIINGNDTLIYPYYLEYEKTFSESGTQLKDFIPDMPEHKTPSPLIKLKHKLLIRTRIKRWLFKISQKL